MRDSAVYKTENLVEEARYGCQMLQSAQKEVQKKDIII